MSSQTNDSVKLRYTCCCANAWEWLCGLGVFCAGLVVFEEKVPGVVPLLSVIWVLTTFGLAAHRVVLREGLTLKQAIQREDRDHDLLPRTSAKHNRNVRRLIIGFYVAMWIVEAIRAVV